MFRSIASWFRLTVGMSRTSAQLLYGVWKVTRLPEPRITIFGGTRLKQDDPFAQAAHELSHRLAKSSISVITGGGPGIMEAANCAVLHEEAQKIRARTLGITVEGLSKKEPVNPCAKDYIVMDSFAARKWLMIHYSIGFAVFPGGFGTLDELAEVVTLMQTKKLPGIPVVLWGKEYWKPLMSWVYDSALKHGLVSQEDINLLRVTDDIAEAVSVLQERVSCVR